MHGTRLATPPFGCTPKAAPPPPGLALMARGRRGRRGWWLPIAEPYRGEEPREIAPALGPRRLDAVEAPGGEWFGSRGGGFPIRGTAEGSRGRKKKVVIPRSPVGCWGRG